MRTSQAGRAIAYSGIMKNHYTIARFCANKHVLKDEIQVKNQQKER